jgi:hypothetical protein
MPHRGDVGEEWEDDFYSADDDECGDEDEPTAEDDPEAITPCPYCRQEIHKESVRCPYCERYLSEEDAPPSRKPWWLIAGVVACLYVVYRWIILR